MGSWVSAAVFLSAAAREAVLSIRSRADARAVARRLRDLEEIPGAGRPYDPEYEAARPDHEVLVVYAGHMGIYYTYDAREGTGGTVHVEWVEDQRADPMGRFSSEA